MGLLILAWMNAANASGFGIEDDTLLPLPPAAVVALRGHIARTDYKDCIGSEFVGAVVDLDGSGHPADWVAKTADSCAWGASNAKIWVLKKSKTHSYRLVLDTGGQVLDLLASKSRGLRDVEVVSATAGHYAEIVYRFNGKSYVELKSRLVNLQDPEECKRNTDVCGSSRP